MDKTYVLKGQQQHDWILVDANEANLGRLATKIAHLLLGKHKPTFTPGVDLGDFVVVVNVDRLDLAPKRLDTKLYHHHSGYPGGLKTITLRDQMKQQPDRVIRAAVWGMLPHNRLGRKLIKRLKIYSGNEHPHAAQQPKPVA